MQKENTILKQNNCQVTLIESCIEMNSTSFSQLRDEIDWRKDMIKIFGKEVPIPRYHAWYANREDLHYQYSNIKMKPNIWTKQLMSIKKITEDITTAQFNSALINLYETGADYAAWHSDDEKELGKNPTIASISLGATRSFHLRNKASGETHKVDLPHGSILLMSGETQHLYKHQLAKTAKKVGPRINITFRNIISD